MTKTILNKKDEKNYILSNKVLEALNKVEMLEMGLINSKLRYEDSSFWNNETLGQAEKDYKYFVALHLLYPEEILVPSKIIDMYWHQHILDTKKYAEDCQSIFGKFLHHDPYFGIGGENDKELNIAAFERTKKLWKESFGIDMLGTPNPCSSTDCR